MVEGYEKLKTVGKGAFGTAVLYRKLTDNTHVVMKEIITLNLDEAEKQSALNEVGIISSLKHPNIIRYLGSNQKEESLVIIMEYADGGNLAQLINLKRDKNENFKEKGILNIMYQICSAISYMHSCKILHRDLKTANIFMNLNGMIKIGDFGISKMLTTKSQAQTVVGTPYYLSPEMCEGSDYNEKSDIWALGCILYELATLRRPFEAQTLPVLVQKITTCQYENIPEYYSVDLSSLVQVILQKKSTNRPSAANLYEVIIPEILKKASKGDLNEKTFGYTYTSNIPKVRSVLYEIYDFGNDQKILPIELPHKKIVNFSSSSTHNIVITSDFQVYTWGEDNFGQLGLGQLSVYRKLPVYLQSLKNKAIIQGCAGEGFSLFLSNEGFIYSCGNGNSGVLGFNGISKNILQPTLIENMLNTKITQIECGSHHAVALSSDGKVFTWGLSKHGELGQGHIQKRYKPFAITLPVKIAKVFCSEDSTVLLTLNGQALVCGANRFFRFGLPNSNKLTTFQVIPNVNKIKQVSIGVKQCVLLDVTGKITIHGQSEQYVYFDNVALTCCGPEFTSIATKDNVVWLWGQYKRTLNGSLFNSFNSDKTLTKFNSVVSLLHTQESSSVKELVEDESNENYTTELIHSPISIIALFSSASNIKMGNFLRIVDIKAKRNSLLLLVDTSTPPPIKKFEVMNRNIVTKSDRSQYYTSSRTDFTINQLRH